MVENLFKYKMSMWLSVLDSIAYRVHHWKVATSEQSNLDKSKTMSTIINKNIYASIR